MLSKWPLDWVQHKQTDGPDEMSLVEGHLYEPLEPRRSLHSRLSVNAFQKHDCSRYMLSHCLCEILDSQVLPCQKSFVRVRGSSINGRRRASVADENVEERYIDERLLDFDIAFYICTTAGRYQSSRNVVASSTITRLVQPTKLNFQIVSQAAPES